MSQSNVERLFTAIINNDPTSVEDIIPRTNVEHFLKECVDKVDCGHCPAPLSRMDVLLETLRDKLINSGSGGKTEQHKTVNITANGTTEVFPDEGKTLSGVTVNTSVVADSKLLKTLSTSSNGTISLKAEDFVGITSLRPRAFTYASCLKSVEFPNTLTELKGYMFQNCEWLEEVYIPDSITAIGDYAFCNCTRLKKIRLPVGLTQMNPALLEYTALESLDIPNTVTEIGSYAIKGISELTNLIIPENVTKIGSYALESIGSATNKATITMLRTTPPSIQSNTFRTPYLNQIIVPVGCGDAYKTATNWATYADYIVEAAE